MHMLRDGWDCNVGAHCHANAYSQKGPFYVQPTTVVSALTAPGGWFHLQTEAVASSLVQQTGRFLILKDRTVERDFISRRFQPPGCVEPEL